MNIVISAEISDGISFPMMLNEIEDKMNYFFMDKNYGESIQKIYAGFICVSQDYQAFAVIRPAKILRKEPALEFEYKLDFQVYKAMNDGEREKYILEEYLKNLKEILVSKKVKAFDYEFFITDLEIFLKKEGYVE
jgi:Immunity protein 44